MGEAVSHSVLLLLFTCVARPAVARCSSAESNDSLSDNNIGSGGFIEPGEMVKSLTPVSNDTYYSALLNNPC